ncbi:MAG: ABC transporter [Sphingomonadaceae bacterium]|nr:ABC transporter [Sphingomonadaceae bacterium]
MKKTRLALAGLVLLTVLGVSAWSLLPREDDRQPLGLVTSLPIYWSEATSLEGMLADGQEEHWARALIEERYLIEPLDTLSSQGKAGHPGDGLAGLDRLLLAQPNALPPADLVALDNWLRGGGKALILADPMLTEHSDFALGDRRRPQGIAMIDPLLARWGLALQFDPDQQRGPREAALTGPVKGELVVDLPGTLVAWDGSAVAGECAIHDGGLLAQCKVGKGTAIVLADAAILDRENRGGAAMFEELLRAAFE